ncbi:hypothetical protein EGI22_03965 [Lacihabitans sp. LS3-19]|uniref:hypothetical protein n=1 Tax=Lacihabitans sp. LS3-19 TaxID=2487335 RepID=UPI0020CE7BD3|nr:hypothetical protein [Lacihabitans sp. LS3-19]MCP9767053.1 hypothetical protein [Lacihabitans sp. LS3-19]
MRNASDALVERIYYLENARNEDLFLLKEEISMAGDKLKPINLIKNTIQDVAFIPNIKGNLLSMVLGFGVKWISSRFLGSRL